MLLAPFLFNAASLAQTQPPPPGAGNLGFDNGGQQLSTGAAATQNTVPNSPYVDAKGQTTLIQQAAEQNTTQTITNTNNQLLQGSELAQYNDTYAGMKAFWGDDMISNFFANIGQVIGRWITELINGWVSDTVQFLTAFLRTFVLNPNIAVNGLNQNPNGANGSGKNDDISPYIRQGADTMYGIAVDLLLLLFILCIWKYWADAAWRGGAGLMGSVGRLIFTAGLLLAWPTIYAFEIQITNEMIKAIYFNSADQVIMLDAAMASAVKGGLVAGVGLLANAFAPVLGSVAGGIAGAGAGGMVLGTVGGIVAFAGLIIYLVLGGVLIAELVYILVLKAIQTALLTAQYMFAPIFIVFFATPDTENVCSGFMKSFIEVSLWTFVWVGLLKILVIILFSDFNPWGKIIMCVGVLQLMIQTPSFMARAQISPMSDFVSAGLVTGGLMKGLGALGNLAQTRTAQLFKYGTSDKFAARGLEQSQKVDLNKTPTTSANPQLSKNLQEAASGTGSKPLGPDGMPIKPPTGPQAGPKPPGMKDKDKDGAKDKDGNPIVGKDLKTAEDEKAKKDAAAAAAAAAAANKPGPRKPGSGATPTTPTTDTSGQPLNTAGKPDGATGSGTTPNLNAGTGGATVADRLATAAKAGGVIAGGAAALSALGAAAQLRNGSGDQSDEARKQEEARKNAEAQAMNAQKSANDLKTHGGETEEEKKKKALEAAQAALQPPAVKQTLQQQNNQPADKNLSEEDKKAKATAAALAALGGGAAGAAVRTAGATGTGTGTGTGSSSSTTAKTEPVLSTATPKLGPTKPGQGNVTGSVVPPIKPVDAVKAAADEAAKKAGENKGAGAGGATAGIGQTLNMAPTDHEHEQDSKGETGKDGSGATLRQPVQVRPVLPGAFAPGAKRDLSAGSGDKTATKGGNAGSAGGAGGTDKGTVTPDVKAGAPIVGTGRPILPNEVKPPTGGTPVVSADGKSVVAHGTGSGAPGSLPVSDIEMPAEEGILTQSLDAHGKPVMIRVVGRPGATRNQGGTKPETVQGIVGPQPPLQQTGSAPVTPITVRPVAPGGASVNPVAAATGTAAHLLGQSLSGAAVSQGRNIDPSTSFIPEQLQESLADAPPPSGPGAPVAKGDSPFDKFRQSNYRWVPPRGLAIDIRTAQGPTMGPSTDGKANIVGNGKGHVNHVRFGANATPEQKAMQVMAAGYAQTFASDSEAFDAARESAIEAKEDGPRGMFERAASGFMAYNGSSFKQTAVAKQRFQKSLLKHAVLGSESYVNGQEGNAFTEYLKGRYGEMTPDQQAWGIHIMTDDTSPESGWNPRVGPATDTLLSAGMPITAGNRAAASNTAVLKQPAWGRGPAIRGVASYVNSIVSRKTGPDTHAMVKDAMIGREAPNVGAAEVGACLAIMLESPTIESGEAACADTNMVQTVAQLVAGGHAKDYGSAYRSLSGMVRHLGGGGGGGSRGTAQSVTMAAPSGGGGGGGNSGLSIGGFSTAGGAAAPAQQNNTVDVGLTNTGSAGMGSIGNIPLPPMNPPLRQQTDINYRANQGGGGFGATRQAMDMPVSGTPGQQDIRIVGMGGGPAPVQRTELDVNARLTSGGNQQGALPPINAIPPNQQQVRQVIDVNIRPGAGQGGTTSSNMSMNVNVDTQLSSGNPEVRVVGDAGSSESLANHQYVEAYGQSSGSGYSTNAADVSSVAQAAASGSRNNVHTAQQIIMDMHAAGFTDDQIQDPRIAQSALDVYQHDASMLGNAAITARIMGPSEFSRGTTQVVQQMVDAGWSSNQISRPDVYTAQSIIQSGGSPTRQYVQAVRMMPDYNPRPQAMLPPQVAAEADRSRQTGGFDDWLRNLGGSGGGNRY